MARSRTYFARSGVVIGGYYAAYEFTADVSRLPAPRSGFVQLSFSSELCCNQRHINIKNSEIS
jgi:hypothetical protein